MEIWIRYKTATLIKPLSSNGELIDRRIYFKNQWGSLISLQNPLPVMPVPHCRLDTKMLNVEGGADIPIQDFTDEFSAVTDDIKMVSILLHNPFL